MRSIFPHEHSAIIVDAFGPLISIALVRKDFLVAVAEVPNMNAENNSSAWLRKLVDEFVGLSERYPLPRTIFLLAPESKISALNKVLFSPTLSGLWLSDNPPSIVLVPASHISGHVKLTETASPDLQMLLMAIYYQNRAASVDAD